MSAHGFKVRRNPTPRPTGRCQDAPAAAGPCSGAFGGAPGRPPGSGHQHEPPGLAEDARAEAHEVEPGPRAARRCPPPDSTAPRAGPPAGVPAGWWPRAGPRGRTARARRRPPRLRSKRRVVVPRDGFGLGGWKAMRPGRPGVTPSPPAEGRARQRHDQVGGRRGAGQRLVRAGEDQGRLVGGVHGGAGGVEAHGVGAADLRQLRRLEPAHDREPAVAAGDEPRRVTSSLACSGSQPTLWTRTARSLKKSCGCVPKSRVVSVRTATESSDATAWRQHRAREQHRLGGRVRVVAGHPQGVAQHAHGRRWPWRRRARCRAGRPRR